MQSILHNKAHQMFADTVNIKQEEVVWHSMERVLADAVLVPHGRSGIGHGEECLVRGGNETPKWLVMGMSQDTFHRDLQEVKKKLPFG